MTLYTLNWSKLPIYRYQIKWKSSLAGFEFCGDFVFSFGQRDPGGGGGKDFNTQNSERRILVVLNFGILLNSWKNWGFPVRSAEEIIFFFS